MNWDTDPVDSYGLKKEPVMSGPVSCRYQIQRETIGDHLEESTRGIRYEI